MKRHKLLTVLLCCMFCIVLLSACGKQAAEDPALTQPTTEATQPQGQSENSGTEGESPAATVPQQTQPTSGVTVLPEPDFEAQPTEPPKVTEPTETSKPSQPTTEAEPTEPTETTEPTQPPELTQPPVLEEDELPLVPLF